MPHALRSSAEDFVQGLKSIEQGLITRDLVCNYVNSMRLSPEALKSYIFFNKDNYTRNLIYRDERFEVMTICWLPGQRTVIHTHNGSLGWMSMVQGEVDVHNYHYLKCNKPENQNVVGLDCLAGATQIDMERIGTMHCVPGGDVNTVDKLQTIHQIENADPSRSGCVSLHVYSPPIDSCVAFDLEHQRCFRRSLRYTTEYGLPSKD
jgi:cysteine dioxygenase